nr:hypothetical protein [Tanacetum cinerariifolium]
MISIYSPSLLLEKSCRNDLDLSIELLILILATCHSKVLPLCFLNKGIRLILPNSCVSRLSVCLLCRLIRKKGCATWDGGNSTWGGRARVLGTVPLMDTSAPYASAIAEGDNDFQSQPDNITADTQIPKVPAPTQGIHKQPDFVKAKNIVGKNLDGLVKKVNDVMRLEALIDMRKVIITEDRFRQALRLDDAESIDCLPNEEIFAELARMGLVRNVDSSSKFYMYPRFLQLMIAAQVGDLSSYTTKYTSPSLTQKVFANMRRVGKGFSGLDTPLFEGMLVTQQAANDVANVAADDVADDVDDVVAEDAAEPTPPSPTPTTTPPPQVLLSSTSQDDEPEPAELREVIEVVTTAKLMTEVVTTAATTITAAPSAARRRKGNKKEDNAVLRYQALKRKPQTEAHARKNMMVYLKNMVGFKMDFFKGMSYDDIRPIFEKHFNSIVGFLEKSKKELEEEASRALKRKSESSEQQAVKKQKLDEEVEKLKKHLQIVPTDEDDVYTEATPLALKMILLVERRYLLTRFTLDQMLNNVRLEVEEESEVSLELLRFVRRQQQEGYRPDFGVDAVEDFNEYTLRDYYCWLKTYNCWYKLRLLDNAADSRLRLLKESVGADDKMKK